LTPEETWCAARRLQVSEYLATEAPTHGTRFGRVGDWPAWHVEPYVSVWAVESVRSPGQVGWWVICGDLPTDYVSTSGLDNPRAAVRAIAIRWLDYAPHLHEGQAHPEITIGNGTPDPELAELLKSRAKLLLDWADDDSVWPDE
jgi:hypothetical protein